MATLPYASDELEEVVDATRPLWEGLRDGRVLITGGTGFFGSWMVETFAQANARLRLGARAVVLARHASSLRSRSLHLAENPAIDLFDADVRGARWPEGSFSHIVHGISFYALLWLVARKLSLPNRFLISSKYACIFSTISRNSAS